MIRIFATKAAAMRLRFGPGKGRVMPRAFLSTTHAGTGTGTGGGSTQVDQKYEVIKLMVGVVGSIIAVSGSTAVAVRHHYEDKAAMEIALAKAEVARVEGERKLAEQHWKAEVARYKRDVQLEHTRDYEPYKAAMSEDRKKRAGTGEPQNAEEKEKD